MSITRRNLGPLLTTSQAARLLGVHSATVARWAGLGRIWAITTPGGHRRIPRAEIEKILSGSQVNGIFKERRSS